MQLGWEQPSPEKLKTLATQTAVSMLPRPRTGGHTFLVLRCHMLTGGAHDAEAMMHHAGLLVDDNTMFRIDNRASATLTRPNIRRLST